VLAPGGRVLVITAPGHRSATGDGVERIEIGGTGGRPDLPAVLAELAARQVNELHVEAGAVLNGALLAAGLVDECLLYLAPMWIGPGRPLAELAPLAALDDAARWRLVAHHALGEDLCLRLRPPLPA
jgi:diaminohydroxyphosphoribosylaminopyrimidine deaminase/5-amino-6-(5-phosphoribosylamino)uracil reductase